MPRASTFGDGTNAGHTSGHKEGLGRRLKAERSPALDSEGASVQTDKILDRDLSRAAAADLRQHAGPLLREVVDYGIAAFERCSATATGLDTPTGILFPFLHLIEMLDATELLLDAAAVAPAHTTLRSAFEADLCFEYVASDDSERRGAAYVVAEIHRRLGALDRFDPSSDKGKQFAASIAKDRVGAEVVIPTVPDLAERRQELQSLLGKPHLMEAAQEYMRIKASRARRPLFYSLWDGPATIEQLATKLGRSGQYDVLYRQWARTAHGLDLSRQLKGLDGEPAVARFRNGEGLNAAYSLAISFGLGAIRRLLHTYRPDELNSSFRNWYLEKIRPDFAKLTLQLARDQFE